VSDPPGKAPGLPGISHGAGAGVGRDVRGELAVEFGEQHDTAGEAKLGAGIQHSTRRSRKFNPVGLAR
jgi:hypothetical protein